MDLNYHYSIYIGADKTQRDMDMIDFKRPVKTRGGMEARIYAHDGPISYPIHGAYKSNDRWIIASWNLEGSYYSGNEHFQVLDLVQDLPRVKGVRWANIDARGVVRLYSTKALAQEIARLHTDPTPLSAVGVEITWDVEKGYGMEGRK